MLFQVCHIYFTFFLIFECSWILTIQSCCSSSSSYKRSVWIFKFKMLSRCVSVMFWAVFISCYRDFLFLVVFIPYWIVMFLVWMLSVALLQVYENLDWEFSLIKITYILLHFHYFLTVGITGTISKDKWNNSFQGTTLWLWSFLIKEVHN